MVVSKIKNWGAVLVMGGKGQRMGGVDKGQLLIGDQSFQDIALNFLAQRFDQIAISVGQEKRPDSTYPQLLDKQINGKSIGPIGGVLAGLDWASNLGLEGVMTIAVDTPILPDDLAQRLCESGSSAYASDQGQGHWLHAAWPVSIYKTLQAVVFKDGIYSLYRLHERLGSRAVAFSDQRLGCFQNVNTQEDFEAVKAVYNL